MIKPRRPFRYSFILFCTLFIGCLTQNSEEENNIEISEYLDWLNSSLNTPEAVYDLPVQLPNLENGLFLTREDVERYLESIPNRFQTDLSGTSVAEPAALDEFEIATLRSFLSAFFSERVTHPYLESESFDFRRRIPKFHRGEFDTPNQEIVFRNPDRSINFEDFYSPDVISEVALTDIGTYRQQKWEVPIELIKRLSYEGFSSPNQIPKTLRDCVEAQTSRILRFLWFHVPIPYRNNIQGTKVVWTNDTSGSLVLLAQKEGPSIIVSEPFIRALLMECGGFQWERIRQLEIASAYDPPPSEISPLYNPQRQRWGPTPMERRLHEYVTPLCKDFQKALVFALAHELTHLLIQEEGGLASETTADIGAVIVSLELEQGLNTAVLDDLVYESAKQNITFIWGTDSISLEDVRERKSDIRSVEAFVKMHQQGNNIVQRISAAKETLFQERR